MTRIGRKPQGVGLLNPLSGSELAKRRMTLFLQTLSGQTSVVQACAELDICESRFYGQRAEWLQESLALLEPRPAGRPAKPVATPTAEEVQALRERLRETEARATALAVQAELAGALARPLPMALGKKTTALAPSTNKAPTPK
jgi:transposase-like protein